MKNNSKLILIILIIMLSCGSLTAQQFGLYSIDTNTFPTMKVTYYAKTQAGTEFSNVQAGDFDLWENGALMNTTLAIDCKKVNYYPPVAIHMMLDASQSMGEDAGNGETRLKWVKDGMNVFLDTLHLDAPSQVAALNFAGQVKNYSGFVDEDSLRRWTTSALKVEFGSTDFGPPYVQKTGIANGALWNLATRDPNLRRVAIFLSDGEPERPFTKAVVDSIVRVAKREKIQCYAIFITTNANPDIWYICQQTGGKMYQAWSKPDLLAAFRDIVGDIQSQYACKLVWQSPFGCDDASRQRDIKVRFNRIPDSAQVKYIAPTTSIANARLSKNQLKFGKPGSGTVRQELTLSAPVADLTINGFSFNPNGGKYTIDWNGKSIPFLIAKGGSHKIYINYIESPPTASQETMLNMTGTPCNPPSVSLIAPCGGKIEASVDFGDVALQAASDKTYDCIYQNTTPIPITGTLALAGTDAGEFSIVQGGGAFTLNPTQCHKVVVRFNPTTTAGNKTAKIVYNTDADCGPAETQLTGKAVNSSFPMPTLDFGYRRILSANDTVYVIKNNTTVSVKITAIALQNSTDSNFTISKLPGLPLTLAPNAIDSVSVRFTPKSEYQKDNYIDLTIENLPGVQSGRLTGIGSLPKITAPDVTFNPTKVLATSGKDLVITNPSTTEDLVINKIDIPAQNDFKLKAGTNVNNLVVPKNGGSINIPFEFTPQVAGLRTIKIIVNCNAEDAVMKVKGDTVILSGLGLGLVVTPAPYDYGNISACGFRDQTFVVDNTNGTATLTFTSQNISGMGAAAFTVQPPIVTSIPVGQKGNIIVRFSPPTQGTFSATLMLRTDNGDADVSLKGTGVSVVIKPDMKQQTIEKVKPGAKYPLEFTIPIGNLEGATIDTMAVEISYYGKSYSYNNIPSNFTAPTLAGWTWNIIPGTQGKFIVSGKGTPFTTPKDLNFKIIIETFLADTSKTNIVASPIFPKLTCVSPVKDTLTVLINTCFTEGRLIYVSENEYMLKSINPNPAGDVFDINYVLSFDGPTKIEIYNSLGNLVKTVLNEYSKEGEHSIKVSADEIANGIYFIRFESGFFTQVGKLIISK